MGLLDVFRRKRLKPGNMCPQSGQYTYSKGQHDQRGCNKGDEMPPPPLGYEGGWWKLTDATITDHRHKE